MRLFLASFFTLSLLSGFVFVVILMFGYAMGYVGIGVVITLTVLFNLIMWLIGPKISDWIYGWLYKLKWVEMRELAKRSPAAAATIERICRKHGFPVPRIGIIPDKNPNAFTYGSGRWNARIVITEGIFEYLNEAERESVIAHELGHIKNYDFIIMTVASTLLQVLYELYMFSRRVMKSGGGGKKKGGAAFIALAGIVAYIFYVIGQYLVLYLSRVREYYADEFAAKEADANALSDALVKISYGILVNPDDVRLVKSTKYLGIADFKMAEGVGLVYHNCKESKDFKPFFLSILYDLKNPWATLLEINSTHPLTGKRIRRLMALSPKPKINFARLEHDHPVDKGRMWRIFLADLFMIVIPTALVFLYPVVYLLYAFIVLKSFSLFILFGGWLALWGAVLLIKTSYYYPGRTPEKSTVLELMSDLYASPVRGRPVELQGELIGRGVPGLIFSEDLVMQDKTGLMYLDFQHIIPLFGDLFFGFFKVPELIGKKARISGWFRRGMSSVVGLREMETTKLYRSHVKTWGIVFGILFLLVGIILLGMAPGSSLPLI